MFDLNARRTPLQLAVAFACFAMSAPHAATLTWDGGGANNSWSTIANWNPNQLPVAGDTLQFGGAVRLTPQNTVAEFVVQGISFIAGAGSFNVGGSAIILNGGGIQNNSASTQTISTPILLNASQTWSATSGPLIVNGGIGSEAGGTLT